MSVATELSGIILTHNNASTIERAVNSLLSLVTELIIVDDGSTDTTLELILALYPEARIYSRDLANNFAAQRNFALSLATYDWVLMIDADEEITTELARDIQKTVRSPSYEAYLSRRDTQVFDRYYSDHSGRPILLKKRVEFVGHIHETVKVGLGYLKSPLLHHSWHGFEDWMLKMCRYSRLRALHWLAQGRQYSLLYLWIRALGSAVFFFLKTYFWEGKWRGGLIGFLYAYASSMGWVFTALTYWEEKRKLDKGPVK